MKRKIVLILIIILGLAILATFLILAFYHPERVPNTNYTNLSTVRAVRVDYSDVEKSRGEVAALEIQMQQAGVNMVAIGAGRPDWTYFPWLNRQDRWSDEVKTTGNDYLLADSTRFGKWAHVSAVVDVLAPLYIQAYPEKAAISWIGVPSKNLVSTMELVEGSFGQDLLDMIENIATYYPVNSITLTELTYYVDGFGEQDKAAYLAYTGRSDWPRTDEGEINIDDNSIGIWRSYEIGRFLEKAAAIIHQHDKLFYVEVRIGVDSEGQVYVNNGTDFNLFLVSADRLIVRGSNEPDGRTPQAMSAIGQYLDHYQNGRVIMGVGLWDKDYDPTMSKSQMLTISAPDFQTALQSTVQGGMTDLWITPSFLMSDAHWHVLKDFWDSQPIQ
ncbi:MAG: hypothetical protein ABIF04_00175 [Chloroflexota bacterium]